MGTGPGGAFGDGSGYKAIVQFWNDAENYIALGIINDPGVSPDGVTVMVEGAAHGLPVGGYWVADMPVLTGASHHFSVQWTPNQISWVIDNLEQYRMTFPINMAAPSFSMLAAARLPGDSVTVEFQNIILSDLSDSLNSIEFLTVDRFWLEAGDTLELLISAKSPDGLNPDSVFVDLEETPGLSVVGNYTVKDGGRELLIAVTIKAGGGGSNEATYYPYLEVRCDDLSGNRLAVGHLIKAHFSANTPKDTTPPSIDSATGDGDISQGTTKDFIVNVSDFGSGVNNLTCSSPTGPITVNSITESGTGASKIFKINVTSGAFTGPPGNPADDYGLNFTVNDIAGNSSDGSFSGTVVP